MSDALVRFVSGVVLALATLLVVQEVLYAAHVTGEGFTAAVLFLIVVLLQFEVHGYDRARRRLPPRAFLKMFQAGLMLLLALVALPLAWGAPLLSPFSWHAWGFGLESAVLFDLAVFLVVAGAMLTGITSVRERAS